MRTLSRLLLLPVLALILGGGTASASSAAPQHKAGDVPLTFYFSDLPLPLDCPNGYSGDCFHFVDEAVVPGFGYVTDSHVLAVDSTNIACTMVSAAPVVLTVAHKGEIDATLGISPGCNGLPDAFTVTGGTGQFTGVTGSGTVTPEFLGDAGSILADILEFYWYGDVWDGTFTLSNYTADNTPPVITGAKALVVRVPKGVRKVRVRYSVAARDDVDGKVPVACEPKSRSFFKLGVKTVTCTAHDWSANTTTRQFKVTVKRARKH
jgi:hypothetical protein